MWGGQYWLQPPFQAVPRATCHADEMANTFGADMLIQAEDPEKAAAFYINQLGFEITGTTPMISLHGNHINLFVERGPALGPVLEVTVEGRAGSNCAPGKERLRDRQA